MMRIVLIDDHAVVRTGYRRLLSAEPGFEVVGEASSADEANALVIRTLPDVALVDLSLKGSSGIEAIRGMLARLPTLRILVLSMHDSAGHVTQALKSGAHGYLTKYCEPDEVIDAIRRVAAGRRAFSADIADILAGEAIDGETPLHQLTPREFEVLRLLAHGETASDIADAMHLSPKTIFNYLSLIRQKLDADSDFKLLHFAARHGLVDMHRPGIA
ncbi:response regulator transcription factor [Dechloromonas sp. CZR5]|uniref:response regulator n=1 Tax=Dechloromonas sp. CZR5 TaxID=2608630 RepID=UPI00123E0E5B|nr:response regulator transcription factor [Dechloromonas sp. CZR5]